MENISHATLLQQRSHRNKTVEEHNHLADILLQLAVELICLQTGEHYVIMKKYGKLNHTRSSYKTQNAIIELSRPSLMSKKNMKVLEATNKIIELLTGEVPIRCQDFTIYFSVDEWKYLEEHKDLFKEVIMNNGQLFGSDGYFKSDSRQNSEKIREPENPENDRAEAVLNITNELIDLLTGECYILVKTPRMAADKQTFGYPNRFQGPIKEPLSHHTIHERDNKKILETTTMILKLLLGEVPIRCQDITVHFSKEEWEYLEGQKDFYKHAILENMPPVISLDENLPANNPDGNTFKLCHLKDRNKYNGVINSTQNSVVISRSGKESIDNGNKNFPSSAVDKTEYCSKKKRFPCSDCGSCFSAKYTLKVHWQLHHERGIFSCTECDETFTSECNLKIHQVSHTGLKPFSCPECHRRFSTAASLASHKSRHALEVSCSCPKCGQSFKSKTTLQSHIYLNHTCSACGQAFDTKYELQTHIKTHPELKNQYSCTECGKYFAYKGNLKVHYRIHTGEKPFCCMECGKTFAYKSHLVSHQRFHTGEGLTCRFCEKFFADRARHVEHERTHTGEKPFACSECGRQFGRKYHLILHQRTHTDVRPLKDPRRVAVQFTKL